MESSLEDMQEAQAELSQLIELSKKKKRTFSSDSVSIDTKKLQNVKDKLTIILESIRNIDCQESIDSGAEHSLLFRLEPKFTNLIERSMNLFFFYQSDVEQLLSTHDYGFLKYQKFRNYLDFRKGASQADDKVLKPIFKTKLDFFQYDFIKQFEGTLRSLEEMRIKNPQIHGKIAKKIVKYIHLKRDKMVDYKE